jgi:Ser/Thr protein kinase RdoA (MazF antagonist)
VCALEHSGLTAPQARRIAGAVARRHGVGATIEPLRAGGANFVFRAGDVVVRVGRAAADVSGQVALARWLVADGFPVAEPLADPEVVEGATVSTWAYVGAESGRPVDFEQLGEIVARLHRVEPARLNGVVALPYCGEAAWLEMDRSLARIEAAGVIDAVGLEALRHAVLGLGDWRERARRGGMVVCHGDVHPHNVLMRGDAVVIVDWDSICVGPPAWDHAALIPWAKRYGGPDMGYREFARGYGADLRGEPLAEALATVRLLAATINTVLMAADKPDLVAEATARLRYWQGDPDAPIWTAL